MTSVFSMWPITQTAFCPFTTSSVRCGVGMRVLFTLGLAAFALDTGCGDLQSVIASGYARSRALSDGDDQCRVLLFILATSNPFNRFCPPFLRMVRT